MENYRPLPKCLTVKKSDIDGLGLFATEDIPADTILGITHVEDSRFMHDLIRTPLGGFFNHSEKPNCRLEKGVDNHIEIGTYKLVTNVDIKKGDELTVTYTLYTPK